MRHIAQGHGDGKSGALTQNTLHVDGAVVLQDDALCDGKTKSRASHFSGSGFIDAIEPVVDLVQGILRDADTGILHNDIEVVGIRVDRHAHLSVIPVVLDRVLNEVGDHHGHLDLIDLRVDVPHADQRQLDVPVLRDGTDAAENGLDHLVDIDVLEIEF